MFRFVSFLGERRLYCTKKERERESINRVFRSRSRVTIERHYARANRLRKTKMHELIFRACYVKRDYVSSLSFNVKLIPRFAASSFPIVFLRYQNRTCSVCLIVFAFNRVYEISTRRARITLLARILFSFFPSFLLLRYVTLRVLIKFSLYMLYSLLFLPSTYAFSLNSRSSHF